MEIRQYSPSQAFEAVIAGSLFLDVREPEEIEDIAYDVPNILYIPLSGFEERFQEVPRDREVIIVCRRGVRSMRVAAFLIDQGWLPEHVVNLEGGIYAWEDAGLPVVQQ
jgi:rhodanese-related sulfurtransferase